MLVGGRPTDQTRFVLANDLRQVSAWLAHDAHTKFELSEAIGLADVSAVRVSVAIASSTGPSKMATPQAGIKHRAAGGAEVQVQKRHHPVPESCPEQIFPVYVLLQQGFDPLGCFGVYASSGTAEKQLNLRASVYRQRLSRWFGERLHLRGVREIPCQIGSQTRLG